jgi:tRNA uridine 5-carbamoylmethylation protein Kti12
MDEKLKETLLQQIANIEDLSTDHLRQLEDDDSIPIKKWNEYYEQMSKVLTALHNLKDDIYYT